MSIVILFLSHILLLLIKLLISYEFKMQHIITNNLLRI